MKLRRVLVATGLLVALTVAGKSIGPMQALDKMYQGVQQFRQGRYEAAIPYFEEALRMDPRLTNAQIYLATSYAQLAMATGSSTRNPAMAAKAIEGFEAVINKEPANTTAITGLAMLYQNTGDNRTARQYFLRSAQLNPSDARALYQVGAIDWSIVHDKTSPSTAEEKAALIEEGLAYLDKALGVVGNLDEAMAYINLLYREKAVLTPDSAAKERLIAQADDWFEKAIATRKKNQQERRTRLEGMPASPPPPPPPPPPPLPLPPGTMRVGPEVMEANLVSRPPLIYPALGRQARIEGSVVLEILVNKEGRVEQIRLVSGHPLLSQAAIDNVTQWTYRPILKNGEAQYAVTSATVTFKLP